MNFQTDTRILVVAAHPDDEVLGCGGTLARALTQGARISVLFLGEGVSARFPFGKYDSAEFHQQTAQRAEEARKALAVLGVNDVVFGNRLCCQFDSLPVLSIVKEIEEHIHRFKPTMLFTHNPSEVNVDHRITFEAVEIAGRPTQADTPKEIYAFEIVCSGNWTFDSSFKPNVYVDITDYWDRKMQAWHCYAGETRAFPFPRSDAGLLALAQFRGMSAGVERAEAFRLLRKVL